MAESHFRALGTLITLKTYGETPEDLLERSEALVRHYEDMLTVNRETSLIQSVNQAAGKREVELPREIYELVALAVRTSQENMGFNALIGPLTKLWHIGFQDARKPNESEIAQAKALCDPELVSLNDAAATVRLEKEGMALDLGAIGKGFIADRLKDFWRRDGVKQGLINLGGNLLFVGDAQHQEDKRWRVGLRSPLASHAPDIAQFSVGECSVVTSGIAERHLDVGRDRFHHIMDPETGYPLETPLASVTVMTETSVAAEIETTRLFFAGELTNGWMQEAGHLGAIFAYQDKSITTVGFAPDELRLLDKNYFLKETNNVNKPNL
ncbi:MAG: FAD:protein FMN transferase [Streptococcaceae bacterium]|jgi:thiamine biosynthesis lipoprotein|nr:FAD:protein FMN transferase [Streptococcaceae bacterium]